MYTLNNYEHVITFLLLLLFAKMWNPPMTGVAFLWFVFITISIDAIYIVGKNIYMDNVKDK